MSELIYEFLCPVCGYLVTEYDNGSYNHCACKQETKKLEKKIEEVLKEVLNERNNKKR